MRIQREYLVCAEASIHAGKLLDISLTTTTTTSKSVYFNSSTKIKNKLVIVEDKQMK